MGYLFLWVESWQATFIVIGLLGFLWLIPWLIVYKSGPTDHPWLDPAERDYILTGQRSKETSEAATYAPTSREILSR